MISASMGLNTVVSTTRTASPRSALRTFAVHIAPFFRAPDYVSAPSSREMGKTKRIYLVNSAMPMRGKVNHMTGNGTDPVKCPVLRGREPTKPTVLHQLWSVSEAR